MLTQYITAIKSFTYDTTIIRDDNPDWTDEEILAYVSDLAYDDLNGYDALVDEDGREL